MITGTSIGSRTNFQLKDTKTAHLAAHPSGSVRFAGPKGKHKDPETQTFADQKTAQKMVQKEAKRAKQEVRNSAAEEVEAEQEQPELLNFEDSDGYEAYCEELQQRNYLRWGKQLEMLGQTTDLLTNKAKEASRKVLHSAQGLKNTARNATIDALRKTLESLEGESSG